jgi:hypothetical protein
VTPTSALPVRRMGDTPAARAAWTGPMGFDRATAGRFPRRIDLCRRDVAADRGDARQRSMPVCPVGHPDGVTPSPESSGSGSRTASLAAELALAGMTPQGARGADDRLRHLEINDFAGNRHCFEQDIA